MASLQYEYRATILKVSGVSLTLGGNLILRDVSFEIKDIHRFDQVAGQVVGLLGPSGIGKSQLFHILAGINRPDSGSVLIGAPPVPVERGMLGVVAQSYPLFAHRGVLGNLLVAGRRAGLSRSQAEEKARDLLQRFRLEDRAGLYPAQLSGGQRQRVAIAQQIMCSELFLLMDEPFSGLDLVAIDSVQELIQEVANSNTLNTIIVVTHDIPAAIEVADTIWLMGRDHDEQGRHIPGARIQASYNLLERGLAWRKGIASTPEFLDLLGEIRERFLAL